MMAKKDEEEEEEEQDKIGWGGRRQLYTGTVTQCDLLFLYNLIIRCSCTSSHLPKANKLIKPLLLKQNTFNYRQESL